MTKVGSMMIRNMEKLEAMLQSVLHATGAPGGAIAVVARDGAVFATACGYRDLDMRLPMTTDTVYPIASTTKAINATLLAMLVERGLLAWDVPVQKYLPRFRMQDPVASALVTLRDLVAMRTGLPRHDFVWITGSSINRAELVDACAHLQLSAAFRERFQYNNLTVTLAAHIAEVVTGEDWEDLVRRNILDPLQMHQTEFGLPAVDDATLSYHEGHGGKLLRNRRFDTGLIGPAGGAIHSTLKDMTRWVAFNLDDGVARGRRLLASKTLKELHTPCVVMGDDPIAPSPNATYGLGWAIDTYDGRTRVSHGGDLHDVISCVTLFPEQGIGMVSFVNFAFPRLARAINQCAFDVLMDREFDATLRSTIDDYRSKLDSVARRVRNVHRVPHTAPSHGLDDYVGTYVHWGHGMIEIGRQGDALSLRRNDLTLPLEHWHYDCWVVAENDLFVMYRSHPLDRASRMVFETNANGEIVAFQMPVEPAAAPVRFEKQRAVK